MKKKSEVKKSRRVRVEIATVDSKEPIALLAQGDLSKMVAVRRYRKVRPSSVESGIDNFITDVWGGSHMLPTNVRQKIYNAALQFTGRMIAGENFLSFELDNKGIPWISITFGNGEKVAELRWRVSDLLASTITAHPESDGGATARALSSAFLAMHNALEKALND